MGHLASNECHKELSEDVFTGQSQALRELAEDRGYLKNRDCVVQHQGKLLRMLPLAQKQFACVCFTKNRELN